MRSSHLMAELAQAVLIPLGVELSLEKLQLRCIRFIPSLMGFAASHSTRLHSRA